MKNKKKKEMAGDRNGGRRWQVAGQGSAAAAAMASEQWRWLRPTIGGGSCSQRTAACTTTVTTRALAATTRGEKEGRENGENLGILCGEFLG